MTVILSALAGAGAQFFDNNGVPLAGGLLYTYSAGTTTQVATYTSSAGSVANSNPIVLDASGRVTNEIWVTQGTTVKFVLQTASATQIWSYDNIVGINDQTALNTEIVALASTSNVAQGASLIGFKQANSSGYLTGATGRTVQAKLEEVVSVLDFGADPTGTNDSYAAITAALASFSSNPVVYFPPGSYVVSAPIAITQNGTRLYGAGKLATSISQITASWTGKSLTTYPATLSINAQQCTVENMEIFGGTASNNSDCIIVGNSTSNSAQLLSLTKINVSNGNCGINFISGNLQRWTDVFAQSCNYGFKVTPDSGDNTNGCIMTAIGAYGCGVGLYVTQGSGSTGHSMSNWQMYVEGGNNGVYIAGGEYCNYDLYVDALATYAGQYYFNLSTTAPHYYYIKNPTNASVIGGIGLTNTSSQSAGMGLIASGGNVSFDHGPNGLQRTYQVSFNGGNQSLQGLGITWFDVSNTGSVGTLALSFLAYAAIGETVTISKVDNSNGFYISSTGTGVTLSPSGITSNVFGQSSTSSILLVTKVTSSTAVCIEKN